MKIKKPNEIILLEDHAEMVLYDRHNKEKARTLISLCDVELVRYYRWGLNNGGYIYCKELNVKLHRFILNVTKVP